MRKGTLTFDNDKLYPKTSADMVIFSDTTVENILNSIESGGASHADSVDFAVRAENDENGNNIAETYLTLNNAAITDTATVPTYTGTDTNVVISAEYMQERIREICGDVESGMTLAKLIEAINRNPNFAADVSAALAAKQDKSDMLENIAGLSLSANKLILTGDNNFSLIDASTLGKNILNASNVENLRHILQVGQAETFAFDETENIHWQKSGSPYISNNALYVSSGNTVSSKESVTFGGSDFTLDFWFYCSAATGVRDIVLTLGDVNFRFFAMSSNTAGLIIQDRYWWCPSTNLNGQWVHHELCYSNGTCYLFTNGNLTNTISLGITRTARQIVFGGRSAAFRNFRILDGVCLHTENFTPPAWSEDYELTDETISLLNF